MKKIKPVLKKSESIYYIINSDMIEFIKKNSKMEWNDICDFVMDNEIVCSDGNRVLWRKKDLSNEKELSYLNENQIKWVGMFFEAHPWIEEMMINFDD